LKKCDIQALIIHEEIRKDVEVRKFVFWWTFFFSVLEQDRLVTLRPIVPSAAVGKQTAARAYQPLEGDRMDGIP
jgi:hypothetical protein